MAARARQLLIAGAGGLARETAEAVRAINATRRAWSLLGLLDDDPATHGAVVGGVPVLGPIDAVHDHPRALVVICTGRPRDPLGRRRIAARLALGDERYATIVHPAAAIGASCSVGAGTVLLAHTALTADVVVGRHVVVMPQAVLTHDVRVGDGATLASGVRLGGGCRVGAGAYLGSGACLRENLRVGAGALVGMGAVVTRDVPAGRLVLGVPGRDAGTATRALEPA